jgi:putative hydrolase of the HAD superfamily
MIKAIFIDWGHVFAESFEDKERKKDAILKPFGFNWRTFLPYWRMFYILRSSGKIKNDNELEKIIRKVVKKDIPVKKIIKIDIENCLIPVEHIDVVKKLKKKYKVAILSNNVQGWVEQDIKNYKIGKLFDAIIISSEVGERKPNAKIYYEALRRLSVKPEESVFIADEVAEDLVAASGLGIKTIWLNAKSKGWWGKDDKNILKIYKPDATIKKLREVINVIEKL